MTAHTKLPLYTRLPAKTEKWAGESCGELVQELSTAMRKITDSAIKKAQKNAKGVQKDAEKKKGGGLWDQTTKGPLADFRERTKELHVDASFLSNSEDGFLQQFYDYMDLGLNYAETAGNLVSNVVNNVVDELGVINQVSEAAGFGSLVPSGQRAACDKTLIAGTVDTIVTIAHDAVGNGLSAVFSAQATIGMGFNAVGDMYAGLMSMPAGYLSILLTNRKELLEGIQNQVNDTVEFAKTLKDEDYPFDHRSFILGLQKRLEEADSELAQLGSILAQGGKFQDRLWEGAEDTVGEVSEELLGSNADVKFRLSLIKLYAFQKFMEQQIKVLNDRQIAFARIAGNIGGFKTAIDGADFQNLTGPVIAQVRCQIEQVRSDMGRTLDVNALLKYIVNERRWGVELAGVYVFMKNMKELAGNLTKPSTGLNDAADSLSAQISAGADSLIGGESYDRLIQRLDAFIREIKRKIARNVDTEILEGLALSINREIEILKVSTGALDEILNNFNNSMAAEGAVALQAVYAVMDVLGEQGLDTLVGAVLEGDLSLIFSADALNASLEGMARKNIGQALQCCSDNAGDGDAARRLINMNKTLADIQKAKAVYDRYTLSFAADFIKRATTKTVPAWKRMQKDVAQVSRAPCMNQGKSGGGAPPGLTLI